MRWIRTKERFGSWCALLALAIQLGVSFSHIHGLRAGYPSPAFPREQGAQANLNTPHGPSTPAIPAMDFCAICAIIGLAGSMVPPAPPSIPLPNSVGHTLVWNSAEACLAPSPHRCWQARAPPQA